MKKYFLLFLMALVVVSCSRTVEVKGKITNANPLDRIEIIDASGVATLPLVNLGVDKNGEFSGKFDAPDNGMYILSYGGDMTSLYLRKGQTLVISGMGPTFPRQYTITGDAKANNDFMKVSEDSFRKYVSKMDTGGMISKNEDQFLAQFNKVKDDLLNKVEEDGKKLKADKEAIQYKKDEITVKLFGLLDAYEQNHGMASGNVSFKVSDKFKKVSEKIMENNDRYVREMPVYRDYMLSKLNQDFQQYAQSKIKNPSDQPMISELFAGFLKQRKDLSKVSKDYFFAYVIAQSDINFRNTKNYDKVAKLIDENISDSKIKNDLKQLQVVLMGYKDGSTPHLKLEKTDGSTTNLSELKGKPTLVMFYASWNPNISLVTVPVLKEVTNFYKSKMNFAYVNVDDTQEQFIKTSSALLKGFPGENYYIKGGINSDEAKKFGIYGFKTPGYIILNKDGKIVGRQYFQLGDPELVAELDKLTGLKAPDVKAQLAPPPPQILENKSRDTAKTK